MIKFADDVFLLHFLRKSDDDNLHNELRHIKSWSTAHGLHFNASKTKLMHFQTMRSIVLPPLIDEATRATIEVVSTAKVLGLVIDNQISWKDHSEVTMKRLRSRIYMLYALKAAGAPKVIIWQVYCTMIRAIATYAFPAWCNIPKTRFGHFEVFERRICKLFNLTPKISFTNFCDSLATRLAAKASSSKHPLNFIYDCSASRSSARTGKGYRQLRSRTARYGNSFIKFA